MKCVEAHYSRKKMKKKKKNNCSTLPAYEYDNNPFNAPLHFFSEYYLKCKTDESGLKESSGCKLFFSKASNQSTHAHFLNKINYGPDYISH